MIWRLTISPTERRIHAAAIEREHLWPYESPDRAEVERRVQALARMGIAATAVQVEAPRPLLSSEGAIFVSLAAAEQYQRGARDNIGERMGLEEARQELTRHMLVAHRTTGDGARYRSRSLGIDITARVVVDRGLVVVTSCSVRTEG